MTLARLALADIRRTLQEIARAGDGERLRRLLRGRELPALGGGEEPAMQIIQALELPPYDADLTRHVGRLCADSARLWLERLAEQKGQAAGDEPSVYNLLLLASWLPKDTELFEALYAYHISKFAPSLLAAGSGHGARLLRRALCNQQTDTRLQDHWLSLLKQPDADSPWDVARRSELLEAWRGILWLPRPSEQGPPLDLETMDIALRLLEGTVVGRVEGVAILRTALRRMADAIPLDPATWVELVAPFWSDWPELLRDLAAERWPALEPRPLADLPRLPPALAELWEAFGEDTRSAILEALNRDDPEAGRGLLNDLAFSPPQMGGYPPQEIRRRIAQLSHVLWPASEARPPVETLYDDRDWREEREQTRGKIRGVDRLAALESVNRGLAAVEQCLRRGDEARARSYLDELVENQTAQGLPDTDIHVAKTLSKAAVLARDAGWLEWAEQLQREACRRNQQDPVAASGLAEVLKTRGELDAAEQQYRANMERWPNDEVAASGLAEVLKTRGELDAAEQQYRANIQRWPNNEVAANGLAEVLKTRGELDAAEQQYRANMERWPNNEVAASGLAEVLKTRGELDAAEQQYRANIQRWPNNEVAANGLAEVLKTRGELDAAEQQYRANIQRWPNNEVAASGLAEVLKARGELDAAERQYRANIQRWPNNEVAASGLADVLKARGELDAAEQQYRANIQRWSNDEVAANGLAEVLKTRGELDAAEQQYRANIQRWPNNEVAANGLAEVLKTRGELDAAEQQYRANIQRWPNNEVAANGLAEVLKTRGELDAAEQQYRANMERWPNDAVARHGLANVLRKQRRHAEALQLLPNPLQPVTARDLYDLHLRGMILLELGRWDDALDAFERGLEAANAPAQQAAFRRGLVLMDLSRRNHEAAQRRLRELPEDIPQLNVYRLHAAAARRDEAEVYVLLIRLEAAVVRMDFTTRTAFQKLEAAYCLKGRAGICEPDAAAYRAIMDAEIEMEQAA